MDRDEAAEDRFDLDRGEARLADHFREFGHRREAADRFDQIAIAVRVVGDQLAEPGHQMVRIGVIGLRESRPFVGREFEAEKAPFAVTKEELIKYIQGVIELKKTVLQ